MNPYRFIRDRFRWPRYGFVVQADLLEHVVLPLIVAVALARILWIYREHDPLHPITFGAYLVEHVGFEASVAGLVALVFALARNIVIWTLPDGFSREYYELLERVLYDRADYRRTGEGVGSSRIADTVYSLRAINARTGKALRFEPDNEAIDFLYKVDGLVSITAAPPSEWLNPTYNFFLINNYLTNLARSINATPPTSLREVAFVDRDAPAFAAHVTRRKKILASLAELKTPAEASTYFAANPISVRFYFLSERELRQSRSTIELLIAGHDLFGCHLFLCNATQLETEGAATFKHLKGFLNSMSYEFETNEGRIDFAVGIHGTLSYLVRNEDALAVTELSHPDATLFLAGLSQICKRVLANYDNDEILFDRLLDKHQFTVNRTCAHAHVK